MYRTIASNRDELPVAIGACLTRQCPGVAVMAGPGLHISDSVGLELFFSLHPLARSLPRGRKNVDYGIPDTLFFRNIHDLQSVS